MVADGMTLAKAHRRGYELVRLHTGRFTDYIRTLDDEATLRPVPDSDWTVGETVAHVRSVYERYTLDMTRADDPHGVAAMNADDVARLGVDIDAALDAIDTQLETMATVVDQVDPAQLFAFHAGQQITMAGGWGNLLGELLAHGHDVAVATRSPFGIPSADLEILWRYTAPALAGWLRGSARDLIESWELGFPFGPISVELEAGALRWAESPERSVDHRILIDDVEQFTLSFPYRRRPIVDPVAALFASRFYDV